MEFTGEYRVPARRPQVWAMLNDPEVLRACLPGCETLEGTAQDGFTARVTTKIGPVKATFTGAVTLSNCVPPERYTISGEGKGGVAGFAKGSADVHLAEDGSDTILTYRANALVGGKLAQLGSRLIDATAKRLADQFFAAFAAYGSAGSPAASEQSLARVEAPDSGAATTPADALLHQPSPDPERASVTPSAAPRRLGWIPLLTGAVVLLAVIIVAVAS